MKILIQILYPILYAFSLLTALFCLPFSRKIRAGFLGRIGLHGRLSKICSSWEAKPVWFHVASSGELEQCLPMLDELKKRGRKIFLSYFSPTAKRALELERIRRESLGFALCWDYADYSPWDFVFSVRSFLDVLGPSHFVAVNREIWPGILQACHQRGVRRYLIATFFPAKPSRFFWVVRRYLEYFEFIGTVNDSTAAFLKKKLSKPEIRTLGDPRVERVLFRKSIQSQQPLRSYFRKQKVLVAGSIWKTDFDALSTALSMLIRNGTMTLRLVIVPHEPASVFIETIKRWFSKEGLCCKVWSDFLDAPDHDSHLIVNSVGELAELYRIASIVFVGGSFKKRVHNVLEPAAYARPILTGPYIHNSPEAMEMRDLGLGLVSVSTAKELAAQLERLLSDPVYFRHQESSLEAYVKERIGASKRHAEMF